MNAIIGRPLTGRPSHGQRALGSKHILCLKRISINPLTNNTKARPNPHKTKHRQVRRTRDPRTTTTNWRRRHSQKPLHPFRNDGRCWVRTLSMVGWWWGSWGRVGVMKRYYLTRSWKRRMKERACCISHKSGFWRASMLHLMHKWHLGKNKAMSRRQLAIWVQYAQEKAAELLGITLAKMQAASREREGRNQIVFLDHKYICTIKCEEETIKNIPYARERSRKTACLLS